MGLRFRISVKDCDMIKEKVMEDIVMRQSISSSVNKWHGLIEHIVCSRYEAQWHETWFILLSLHSGLKDRVT